jgi:hypothetical protein
LEAALEALVQARNVPAPGNHPQELDRLHGELAQMQVLLAERDNALAQYRVEVEQQRESWRREAEASLEATVTALRVEESARTEAALATARVQSEATVAKARAQSEEALSELALRCEQAERALAEVKSEVAAPATTDDGYVASLHAEVLELRKALAAQEVELGWARAALDESRPLHLHRAGENLPITNFQGPDEVQEESQANAGAKRTLVRDCLLVAGLVVPLIVFYPWIAAYLPNNVQSGIASMTGGLLSAGTDKPVAAHASPPPAAAPVQRPTATVAKSVKVRATPVVKGTVVVTLQKGASVVVLEQQGSWTHVEIPAKDAASKPQQGWVYSSYLDAAGANSAKPNAAKPSATIPNALDQNSAKTGAANPTPASSKAAKPDVAKLDAAKPDVAKPDAAKPDAVKPDAANSNAADPNAAGSNIAKPDAANSNAADPNTAK